MSLAYIIEDNEVMGELFARYLNGITETKVFHDAISAINSISSDKPDMIFLDVLLTGPDGFTFLNEIVSYEDTAKIPVVLVTSLDIKAETLENYNVKKILRKENMLPEDFKNTAREILEEKVKDGEKSK
ncbi:response regulator [Candidatus Saccharibacteria bacterium]|nr:response regulator [Candidatus Saccharibacteria bacterium]